MKSYLALTALILSLPLTALAELSTTNSQVQQLALSALKTKGAKSMAAVGGTRFDVSLKTLPDTIQLKACQKSVDVSFLTDSPAGTQRLQLRCPPPSQWSIYMKGQINVYVNVLISRRSLTKGDTVLSPDITSKEANISDLRRGYLTRYSQLNNMQVARRIKAGEIITPSMMKAEQIIQRGDRVTLIARSTGDKDNQNNFKISMPGEAMGSGSLNQQIRVKNLSSGKILKGRVISSSEILVQ